jgi:hypothetical protein
MFYTPWIKKLRLIIAQREANKQAGHGLLMLTIHYQAEIIATREGWLFEKLPYEHEAWGMM